MLHHYCDHQVLLHHLSPATFHQTLFQDHIKCSLQHHLHSPQMKSKLKWWYSARTLSTKCMHIQPATLPPWKLLGNSLHPILLLQLKRLVTARSSPNTLPTNQGGRILTHFTLLIGRQDHGQASWCPQGRDWHSLSWGLLCLPKCQGTIRWNELLTTGAPGAKSSRKHWPMSSNVQLTIERNQILVW